MCADGICVGVVNVNFSLIIGNNVGTTENKAEKCSHMCFDVNKTRTRLHQTPTE